MENQALSREKVVGFVTNRLLRDGFPRFQIIVMLLITALAGFLTSVFLLKSQVHSMTVRYPFAIIVAYCVFLVLLRIWLWIQKDDRLDIDLTGVSVDGIYIPLSGNSTPEADIKFGGGGDFGGGGAGGTWSGGNTSSQAGVAFAQTKASTGSAGGAGSFFGDLEFDEAVWLIVVIAALTGAFLAAIYIIYIAPVLLAEILVDGVLVTGLYRRVKKIDQPYWLKTAVKKTLLPAVIIAICFGAAGFGMQEIAPEADSIGAIWKHLVNN